MPKIVSGPPSTLKPYFFHGVDLQYSEGDKDAYADCPLCGREAKFSVKIDNGVFRCLKCNATGNAVLFVRQLWEVSSKDATASDEPGMSRMQSLTTNRKLLSETTLEAWGVRVSPNGDTIVPGYSADRKIVQLYRYVTDAKSKKRVLLATSGLHHGLFGVSLYDSSKPLVYLCEGPWDAMVLWEVLQQTKSIEGELSITGSESSSLLASANVLAVPGCSTFSESWCKLLGDKNVVLLYDNDHPRGNNGQTVEGAAYSGMKRVAEILSRAETLPKSVSYLRWGNEGFDKGLPSGYDVRDTLAVGEGLKPRIEALAGLLRRIEPIPSEWLGGGARKATSSNGSVEVDLLACDSWPVLINQWRKAMKWTEGLERGLIAMLATVISTNAKGDSPLWIKVMSPPSSGKTTLCEAISLNRKYVKPLSTMTGFHSGYKTDATGEEDHSLINKLRGMTLVTKDGDPLLQSSTLGQTLSEARDLYDGASRTHYKHAVARDYEALRVTWILCGTAALRSLDSSELGARLLDVVIMEEIDHELEVDINRRVGSRTARNMLLEGGKDQESQTDPALFEAMRLTAGYVDYLRENYQVLFTQIEVDDASLDRISAYAMFVAYIRARPSKKQDETVERELSPRLMAQLTRMAMCTAAVLGRKSLDKDVMELTKRIALDTAKGRTLEIAKVLYEVGQPGIDVATLLQYGHESEETLRKLLKFLRRIKVVESFTRKVNGVTSKPRWRLTERLDKLYREVHS